LIGGVTVLVAVVLVLSEFPAEHEANTRATIASPNDTGISFLLRLICTSKGRCGMNELFWASVPFAAGFANEKQSAVGSRQEEQIFHLSFSMIFHFSFFVIADNCISV
jgi:hypothetical protein